MVRYDFDEKSFTQMFPFFLLLNKDFVILRAGHSMKKLVPLVEGEVSFPQIFKLIRPIVKEWNTERVVKMLHSFFVFDSCENRVRFRGQIVPHHSERLYYFLGGPFIDEVEKIKQLELKMQDFALHDRIHDFLLSLQTTRISLDDARSALQRIIEKNSEIERINQERIRERTETIRNLLEQAGEGFLIVNKELIVQDEYSLQCERIFVSAIANKNLLDIFQLNPRDQDHVTNVMKKLFDLMDPMRRELYLKLLPEQLIIHGRYIDVRYKFLFDLNHAHYERCLITLTDSTEKIKLMEKRQFEQKILKMVVSVIKANETFWDLGEELNQIILEIELDLRSKRFDLKNYFRIFHTLKGSFMQLDAIHTPEKIHQLETDMLNIMHFQGDELFEAMQNILSSYSLVDAFEQDLKLLEEYVSFDQLKAENIITIEEKRFHSIRQEVIVQVPSLLQEHVSQTIEKMRYKTVYDCLRPYDNVVQKIGERLQKPIAPIRFIGPEIYVDAQRFQLFFKSLIHIFRNAIDHGIETLEERIAFEKEQNATISCTWSCNGNRLVLQIADDGQGVDSEKIRSKIVEKQLLDQDSASELNEEQLFAYIFHEQFSTKDEDVTLWSGRGVGLSFVHEVVKSFGGSVTLESEKGKGTTFILDIEMD